MKFIASSSNIYHRDSCKYVKRIKGTNKKTIHLCDDKEEGTRFCKHCCSTKKAFEDQQRKHKSYLKGNQIFLWMTDHQIYGRTSNQGWKIDFDEEEQRFLLFRQTNRADLTQVPHKGVFVRWDAIPATRNLGILLSVMNEIEEEIQILQRIDSEMKAITQYSKEKNIDVDADNQKVYVRTNYGCWMLRFDLSKRKWVLFHLSQVYEHVSLDCAKNGLYHRQNDQPFYKTALDAMKYIFAHDNARRISGGDYRKLPRANSKQKHYYQQAKKKAEYKSARRLDALFALIGSDKNYSAVSV